MDEQTNVRERRFEVDQNFEGWRLDRFLANRVQRLSRTRAGEIARHGDVTLVPPRKAKPSLKLRIGDTVILREHLPPERIQDGEVSVIHEDGALLILNKPAGMLVHETPGQRLNTIQHYLDRAGFEAAGTVHRLDRETSGVLVCAARKQMVAPLRQQFTTGGLKKVYRALVMDPEGRWPLGHRAVLNTPLGLTDAGRVRLRMTRGPLPSTTHVEVLGHLRHAFGPMADLRVRIETGRQHQIRIHLAMEGTPVAGDKLYTFDDAFFIAICDDPENTRLLARLPFARHALHAWQMTLTHPITGDEMTFEAPLPRFFSQSLVEKGGL